jgi:hypothetical protein
MKIMKCILSVLFSAALFCSCGGGNTTTAVQGLTGKVTLDGYEGRKVYLETTDGSAAKLDSAVVTDGKFAFTFNDSVPQVYSLVLAASDDDQYPITLPVVSERGSVKVSMGELVLTSGTPLNDALQDFLLAVSNFYDKALQQEKPDLKKIGKDFAKLVEGAVMGNINTPVGAYIYRTYSEKLDEQQKAQILLRGGESFRKAVNQ